MTLQESLEEFFIHKGIQKKYWIGLSGGLDSSVLLHLCAQIRAELPVQVSAVHIHHGLSRHADAWESHCKTFCSDLGVNLIVRHIQIEKKSGESLEALARKKRYEALANFIEKDNILLTAHQQDDQAETLLLQLFRGAGLKGLSAMPAIKPFAQGFHARPLLPFSRSHVHQYAVSHQLKWIEDESNQSRNILRNFIRHDVLAVLKMRLPTINRALTRAARHSAEANELLETFAREHLETLRGSQKNTLSVRALLKLSREKQKLILRTWLQDAELSVPNHKKLNAILQNVLHAKRDATPFVTWGSIAVRRFRDDLYAMRNVSTNETPASPAWNFSAPLLIEGVGELRAESRIKNGCLSKKISPVHVCFRMGGEKVFIKDRGHRALKKLFQEWNIPPWQRQQIPLLFVNEILVSVVGYFVDHRFVAKENEEGVEIIWHPSS